MTWPSVSQYVLVERFYSDRLNGPAPQLGETLPDGAKAGLINLVLNKIEANWFAASFPDNCYDGHGIAGTNRAFLIADVQAVVPGLEWPPRRMSAIEDETVFDFIEYASDHVQLPSNRQWHKGLGHYELAFNRADGQQQFRDQVNQILRRNGTVFELTSENRLVRRGNPEALKALDSLRPDTGDAFLDELVERGRSGYLSHRKEDRRSARDALWDAFERVKTTESGKDKKSMIEKLLSNIDSDEFRSEVDKDMKALSNIGNNFMIRHHETNKIPVPPEADDYLVGRISLLLGYLLELRERK